MSEILLENYIRDFIQNQPEQEKYYLQEGIIDFLKSSYKKLRFDKEKYKSAEEAKNKTSDENKKALYKALKEKELDKAMNFDIAITMIIAAIMSVQGLSGTKGGEEVITKIVNDPTVVETVLSSSSNNNNNTKTNQDSNDKDFSKSKYSLRNAIDFSRVDADGVEMTREQFNLWQSLNDRLDSAGYPYFDPNVFIKYELHLIDKKSADRLITSYIDVMNKRRENRKKIASYEEFFDSQEKIKQFELEQSTLSAGHKNLASKIINDDSLDALSLIDDSSKDLALQDIDGISSEIQKEYKNIEDQRKNLEPYSDEYNSLTNELMTLHKLKGKLSKATIAFNNIEDGKFVNDSYFRYSKNESNDFKKFLNNYLDEENQLQIEKDG